MDIIDSMMQMESKYNMVLIFILKNLAVYRMLMLYTLK